jgi:DNA end-binding protein Ku
VLIRPLKGGLVLQFMYHEDEVRDFGEIAKAEGQRLTPAEFELATGLVEKLSSAEFEPEAYSDEYRERVKAMLDQKAKGQEITIAPPAPPSGHVVNLMDALKESMRTIQRGSQRAEQKKRRKA